MAFLDLFRRRERYVYRRPKPPPPTDEALIESLKEELQEHTSSSFTEDPPELQKLIDTAREHAVSEAEMGSEFYSEELYESLSGDEALGDSWRDPYAQDPDD